MSSKIQKTIGGFDLSIIRQSEPTLIVGDCLEIMPAFPEKSISCIIDDCGYLDLEKHRSQGTTTRMKISKSSSNNFYETVSYEKLIPIYARLLQDTRHIYFWRPSFNRDSIAYWCLLIDPEKGLLKNNGFTLRKIIPCKKSYRGMGYSYNSQHENIMACTKEEIENLVFAHTGRSMEQLNDLTTPDIFLDEWKNPHDNSKIHVSEKPTSIYSKILKASTNANDIVLEPFAGSFQSGMANCTDKLGLRVIGMERDKGIADKTIQSFQSKGFDLQVIEWENIKP